MTEAGAFERRTSNIQHRTSKSDLIAMHRVFAHLVFLRRANARQEVCPQDHTSVPAYSLSPISMFDVPCSMFDVQNPWPCTGFSRTLFLLRRANASQEVCPPDHTSVPAYSLSPISMFDVPCSMFDVRCSVFDVRCSMFKTPVKTQIDSHDRSAFS